MMLLNINMEIGLMVLIILGIILILLMPKKEKIVYVTVVEGSKKPGWLKKRKINRHKFIKKNKDLCKQAFSYGTTHYDYKTDSGMKLIEKARAQLEYKSTTYSGDIYFGLWKEYEEIILHKNK